MLWGFFALDDPRFDRSSVSALFRLSRSSPGSKVHLNQAVKSGHQVQKTPHNVYYVFVIWTILHMRSTDLQFCRAIRD